MKDKTYLYIYDDHCGNGYYVTDEELDYDTLYCETCGDSDTLVTEGTKKQIIQKCKDCIAELINEGADEWEIRQAHQELEEIEELIDKYLKKE